MRNNSEDVLLFLQKIRPYFGFAFDFDDTLACSEIVAASVTANLVNPYLKLAKKKELTAEYVCRHYSGLSFAKQIDQLKEEFGITIPSSVMEEKERRNLEALAVEARPIPGAAEALSLIRDFKLNAIVLTASKPDRVEATARCAGLDKFLTTDLSGDDGRIPVISAETKTWKNQEIPPIPHKPAPDGYLFVAKILGQPSEQLIAFEDSLPGVVAADKAGYGAIALVSLSRRCGIFPDHIESLTQAIQNGREIVPVRSSWVPAFEAALKIGLKAARNAGVENLPEELPSPVRVWLRERLSPVRRVSLSPEGASA